MGNFNSVVINGKNYSREFTENKANHQFIRDQIAAGKQGNKKIVVNNNAGSFLNNGTQLKSNTPTMKANLQPMKRPTINTTSAPKMPKYNATNERNNINSRYQEATQNVQSNFHNSRNQVDAVSFQNKRNLNESMAANGLNRSGDNISANVNLNNQRIGAQNDLHQAEGNNISQLNQNKLSDMNELQRYADQRKMQEYGMERDNFYRDRDYQYQIQRDQINDSRYQDGLNYSRGRDQINDDRYSNQWDRDETRYQDDKEYNRGRDQINDERYQNSWDRDNERYQDSWDRDNERYQDGWDRDNTRYKDEQDYRAGRDKVKDSQWNKTYELNAAKKAAEAATTDPARFKDTVYKNSNQESVYNFAMDEARPLSDRLQTLSGFANNPKASREEREFARDMLNALNSGRWNGGN